MLVSIILTVLNEGDSICALLDSLIAQTHPPTEVVIVDGGSRDNTVEVMRQYADRLPLKIISVPGANISQGRNAAIHAATNDLIAVTDAGVRCEPTWLEKLIAPFNQSSAIAQSPHVVAGFFHSDPQSLFEMALGATILPEVRDVNPQTFLPSSRSVAFRKSAWAAVGGYPEWLDFCEDVVFDLNLRPQFGPFVFAPEAVVHFRPRGSWQAFAKQYYQYARGDGKANLFFKQHGIRYLTYLVIAPLLVYAALTVSPGLWGLGFVAGLAYIRLPLRRLWPHLAQLSGLERLYALALIPLIRLIGDGAKMVGYPVGVWWRWRR